MTQGTSWKEQYKSAVSECYSEAWGRASRDEQAKVQAWQDWLKANGWWWEEKDMDDCQCYYCKQFRTTYGAGVAGHGWGV